MTSKITDTDRGFAALAKRLAGARRVRVGILSDEPKEGPDGEGSALSLIEIAIIHEFGAPGAGIPQRSFIRATVDEHRADIEAMQVRLAKQIVVDGLDPDVAMQRLGAYVAGLIKARIARGIDPPNAQRTIDAKGSSKPLVDTGQLRSSIAYVVEK